MLMSSKGGPPRGFMLMNSRGGPPFEGCMLIDFSGGPPILRGGPPLGTIFMDLGYVMLKFCTYLLLEMVYR